ncbi:MAG: hypothetical protein L0216_21405 [Planctomycetales bacterium]|nr:hypothetical protein [Planctomycetales bacterium]
MKIDGSTAGSIGAGASGQYKLEPDESHNVQVYEATNIHSWSFKPGCDDNLTASVP